MKTHAYRLAIDIGGTFTDCVLFNEVKGTMRVIKVPTTPDDPSEGFLSAVQRAVREENIAPEGLQYIVHATTVATNAILEGKLSPIALVVTEGFGDILEIGRQIRPVLYDLDALRPEPLVPRWLCLEVKERVAADGTILIGLDEEAVQAAAAQVRAAGVQSVVVCFLHSYINDEHERRAVALLQQDLPGVFISASSKVSKQWGEYARVCTALVNAGLVPKVSQYFARLRGALQSIGLTTDIRVMQSNGGVLPSAMVTELPVHIVESGPAAGVIGAAELARHLALPNVVSFDMGGTTAKAGLVRNGAPYVTREYEVGTQAVARVEVNRGAGYPIKTSVIDLVEVGAGGGSIAWVDSGGVLRVGPQSAGADPGPACYGRGNESPTVTDANLALGRINPEYFLGGEIELSVEAARTVLERGVASRLGISVVAAARGVLKVANASMLKALRMVSIQRGFDPRGFTFVCFGGAAGLHADVLARSLPARNALIPLSPGVGTARGLLSADIKREFRLSRRIGLRRDQVDLLNTAFAELSEQARGVFSNRSVDVDNTRYQHGAELRFVGQSFQLQIPVSTPPIELEELEALGQDFRTEHCRLYGYAPDDEPIEVVDICVTAVADIPKPQFARLEPSEAGGRQAIKCSRPVYFDDDEPVMCVIYSRYALGAGDCVPGPAIIEEKDSTILVLPGSISQVDHYGNIILLQAL